MAALAAGARRVGGARSSTRQDISQLPLTLCSHARQAWRTAACPAMRRAVLPVGTVQSMIFPLPQPPLAERTCAPAERNNTPAGPMQTLCHAHLPYFAERTNAPAKRLHALVQRAPTAARPAISGPPLWDALPDARAAAQAARAQRAAPPGPRRIRGDPACGHTIQAPALRVRGPRSSAPRLAVTRRAPGRRQCGVRRRGSARCCKPRRRSCHRRHRLRSGAGSGRRRRRLASWLSRACSCTKDASSMWKPFIIG